MPTLEEKKAAALEKQARQKQNGKQDGPGEAQRAAYVNEVSLSGRLGKDVEMEVTTSGICLLRTSLAVWQPAGKGKELPTMWLDVTMWEPNDKSANTYAAIYEGFAALEKGTEVVIMGRLTMREWEGRDGVKRQSWGITATAY